MLLCATSMRLIRCSGLQAEESGIAGGAKKVQADASEGKTVATTAAAARELLCPPCYCVLCD